MNDQILYHGSRGGIVGDIKPCSRIRCDFGAGFYLGSNKMQAKTLVYNDVNPIFYTMKLELSKIPQDKILILKDMEWAFYVLYNRGRLEGIKGTNLYDSIQNFDNGKELIIGPIADDNMNNVMRKFVDGDITDKVFLECIRCINYGIQYVPKTEKLCKENIEILSSKPLDMSKYQEYQEYSQQRRLESETKVKLIKQQYRHEGKYLDQILEKAIQFPDISLDDL